MCGIFGVVATGDERPRRAADLLAQLFELSESRGKEAAGLAGVHGGDIRVLKSPVPTSQLMRSRAFTSYVRDVVGSAKHPRDRVAVVGHSRLVTNGSQTEHANNQPVCAGELVGVHNGIIVNDEALWRAYPQLRRDAEVDTEVLLRLIRHHAADAGSFVGGVRRAFAEIYGVANVALFASELDQLTVATNNGSIYYAHGDGVFVFASEEYILRTALERAGLDALVPAIVHLAAAHGVLVDLSTAAPQRFSLDPAETNGVTERNGIRRAIAVAPPDPALRLAARPQPPSYGDEAPRWFLDEYERNREAVSKLRRCVRCIQPETVPFVGLDAEGVCIDCRRYVPIEYHGRDALLEKLAAYRRRDGRPEVLVPLSGGRDSCYVLHYLKTELGIDAIAYTYDWGTVTDLARRNASRMCSKLGVEHIVVSADIAKKRHYIRKNIEAWLRRPDLGLIPLFMAGDKQFYYYAELLQKQTGVGFQIWGHNRLERTDFKTGFCGFERAGYRDNSLIRMSALNNARLLRYYLTAYLRNPAYLNTSIPDTLFAYFVYYVKKLSYLDFFDYIEWDEERVVRTLIDGYDWETSPDTKTTWRIGDGTASFYNYIYWTGAGFTESDTFRSYQVRAGLMSRDQALAVVEEENRPRYQSLTWYSRIIGLDLHRTIKIINAMPKRYAV